MECQVRAQGTADSKAYAETLGATKAARTLDI